MKKILSSLTLIGLIFFGMFYKKDLVSSKVNKGIEFAGGLELLTSVSSDTDSKIDVTGVAQTIAKRIDAAGVKNPQIDIEQGSDDAGKTIQKIRTTIAGIKADEIPTISQLITSKGLVTFRDVYDSQLAKGIEFLEPNGASLAFQEGQPIVSMQVKDRTIMRDMSNQIRRYPDPDNKMVIWIDYDPETDSYTKYQEYLATGKCYKSTKKEVIKLCNKVVSAASVNSELNGDVIISGSFTAESARELASYINSGSFEYNLKVEETNQVSGAYGKQAFAKAIKASKIAIWLVALFMLAIYGVAGAFSVISLLVYLFLVLASFNWLGGEYGADTIAALVVGFGMAADASIILFERLKDELLKGQSLATAFEKSNQKSLSTILDANFTTFIVAFVLFQFGSRTVKGFAIMLSLSIFWTIIVVVFLTRLNLTFITKSKFFANKRTWFGVRAKHLPNKVVKEPEYEGLWAKVNFLKHSRKIFASSLVLIGLGTSVAGLIGTNNSIQFDSGTRISIHTPLAKESPKIDDARNNILKQINKFQNIDVEGYTYGSNVEGNHTITINTKDDLNQSWTKMKSSLDKNFPDYRFTASSVSSNVAKDTAKNAFVSMLWAVAAIIIYITIRFKWSYAIAAIVALLHDSLIVYAVFSLLRIEISVPFVSAILAIIGYSINDTIVSFDRIREKMQEFYTHKIEKSDLVNIANAAIRQTATRSMFTTITTLLAIFSLLFFGTKASLTFNIAMLVGLVVGTYSSIWIAAYIWIKLESFRINRVVAKKVKPLPKIKGEPDENIFPGINY